MTLKELIKAEVDEVSEERLIAARDHSGEGAADRDGGLDPHSGVGEPSFFRMSIPIQRSV
jgi:hypothetical protein